MAAAWAVGVTPWARANRMSRLRAVSISRSKYSARIPAAVAIIVVPYSTACTVSAVAAALPSTFPVDNATAARRDGFDGFVEGNGVVSMEAEHFTARVDRGEVGWRVIPGLGRTGSSVAVFPTTAPSVEPDALAAAAPRLEYRVEVRTAGTATVTVSLVPTFPIADGRGLRLGVGLDDAPPRLLVVDAPVDSRAWAQGVLDNTLAGTVKLEVPNAGAHVLRLYMVDPGVVVDKLVLDFGGVRPSWLGPPETRAGQGGGR